MLAKRKAQKQLGDDGHRFTALTQTGDEIVFKSRDGKVRSATVQMLAINVDRDGDGVPDVVTKGKVSPNQLRNHLQYPSSKCIKCKRTRIKTRKVDKNIPLIQRLRYR